MKQNAFTLGILSFLVTTLILTYIISPGIFSTPYAYAQGSININKNEVGIISGIIQSPNGKPLSEIPIIIKGFNDHGIAVNIATGTSNTLGKFSIILNSALVKQFKNHKIIILFTINGKTQQTTFNVTLDDATFKRLFVDEQFLPSPPFTVIAY